MYINFQKTITNTLVVTFLLTLIPVSFAEAEEDLLPLGSDVNFEYQGAFRLPVKKYGSSRLSYLNGNFAINESNNSFFIAGHQHHQAIAEFTIPELKKETKSAKLNLSEILQSFQSILLNKKRLKNPQKINRITGMEVIEGELFVNGVEYYDAKADNTHTTFIIRDISDLSNSKVDGFFSLQGAVHAAGWLSKMPNKWQHEFKASYIHGFASNLPVNVRSSMGPSAFTSGVDAFSGIDESGGLIPTQTLMNYSVKKPLQKDLYNKSKKNSMWTEVSHAVYGFIVPNSNKYLVLGSSGGHDSGLGYKITQKNGKVCGGPCAYDPIDYYDYFWMYDVEDLLKSSDKKISPSSIKPSSYNKLSLPIAKDINGRNLIASDFDFKNNKLYLLLENADRSQNKYEVGAVMLVYKLNANIAL
jgi:hypothetical protein